MSDLLCPKCKSPIEETNVICGKCGADLSGTGAYLSGDDFISEDVGDICKVGDVINGRYVVQSLIGRGGMGAVYKVLDSVLEEVLALKILLPQFVTDKVIVERFINEVRITRKIAHPNIVRVHDIGAMGDSLFISMEYVDGESLRNILDHHQPDARLSVRQSIYIISQLCIALKYAHRYTIHRDIKPDNIMVTRKNHIKLMDFGIAKLHDARFDTHADAVVGTLSHMAPEQMHHAPDVDGRADIYSLGVVLHELVTGRLPSGLMQPVPYEYNEDIPLELDNIIAKCLNPDRNKRFTDPAELRDALRAVSENFSDNSSPGFSQGKSSASDAAVSSVNPLNFTSAMEAFLKEEQLRDGGSAGGTRFNGLAGGSLSNAAGSERNDAQAEADLPPLMDSMTELRPRISTVQPRRTEGFFFRNAKILIGAAVLLGIAVSAYFGVMRSQSRYESEVSALESQNKATVEERAQNIINQSGNLLVALGIASADSIRENTEERQKIAEIVRQSFFKDIEARMYCNPFDMKKLNSASNDVVQARLVDKDPRTQALAESANREVALFKFVVTEINEEQQAAVFRLNNPFSTSEVETVKPGDLLQKRFKVVRFGVRSVYLEDTEPKCAGRQLVARLQEPVSAS